MKTCNWCGGEITGRHTLDGDKPLHRTTMDCAEDLKGRLVGLQKEAKFRMELADLWVAQLRGALGEAMDALASNPNHDVALQARLELTRRGVMVKRSDESPKITK